MKIITGLLFIVLQNEVKRLTEDNEVLKKTLGLEKEKLHALEAAVEDLHKKGECSLPLCISLCTCIFLLVHPSFFFLKSSFPPPFFHILVSFPLLSPSFSVCLSLSFYLSIFCLSFF